LERLRRPAYESALAAARRPALLADTRPKTRPAALAATGPVRALRPDCESGLPADGRASGFRSVQLVAVAAISFVRFVGDLFAAFFDRVALGARRARFRAVHTNIATAR
jgi:hypothetical protein